MKKIFKSRVVLLFIVLHFILIGITSLVQDKTLDSHELYYQPTIYKILFYRDIPSFAIAGTVYSALCHSSEVNSCQTQKWIAGICLIFFSTIQWALIGYGVQKFVEYLKRLR